MRCIMGIQGKSSIFIISYINSLKTKSQKKKERKNKTPMTTWIDGEKPFETNQYLSTIKPISKLEIEEYFYNLIGDIKQNKLQLTS